jgi:hypothetical protein
MFLGAKLLSLVFFISSTCDVFCSIEENDSITNSPGNPISPLHNFRNHDLPASAEPSHSSALLEKIDRNISFSAGSLLLEELAQAEKPPFLSLVEVEECLGVSCPASSDADKEIKQLSIAPSESSPYSLSPRKVLPPKQTTRSGPYKLHEGWLLLINEITSATLPSLNPYPQVGGEFKEDRTLKRRCYNTIAAVVRSWLRSRPEYAIYSLAAEEEFWIFAAKRRPRSHSFIFDLVNPRKNMNL